MRLGIDLRGINYDSAQRGIGSFTASVCEGLALYAPEIEPVLFVREGFPLAPRLAELPASWPRVAVKGVSWQDARAHWRLMRVPKVRSLSAIRDRYYRWLVKQNSAWFSQAVQEQKLDLMYLPTAVDLGSYPTGNFHCPVAATFLDAIPLLNREAFYDKWFLSIQETYDLQLEGLRNYERVIPISQASAEDAANLVHVPKDRIQVVYCGLGDAYYQAPSEEEARQARERFGLDRPTFLFISALDEHKNWRRLLEAFVPLKDQAQLLFVSKTSGPAFLMFQKAVGALGFTPDQVRATGWLEDEELRALTAGVTALASPSLYEGFGLPAAQALAQGTPVAASNRSSLPEVVQDAGILFDPTATSEMTEALGQMLDPAIRADLAAKAKPAAQKFRLEETTRQLVMAFQDAIG